jgi:hypothetical protein
MTGSAYLKQLAARTRGDLPILTPPRSPFSQMGTTQAIESFSERITPTTPTVTSFPARDQVERLSSRSRIEPTGTTRDQAGESLIDTPQLDTILPSSPIRLENSTEPNSPPTVAEPKSAEVTADQQSSSFTEINAPQELLPRIRSLPPLNLAQDKITSISQSQSEEIIIEQVEATQPKLVPNSSLKFRSARDRGDDQSEGKEIKTARLPRLSPRDHDNFPSPDENHVSLSGARSPLKPVPNSDPINQIKIGAIEIQITPPAPPPPVVPVAKTAIRSKPTVSLSRGFTSGFGLRQG